MKKFYYKLIAVAVFVFAWMILPSLVSAAVVPAAPDLAVSNRTSANWSGYIATKGTYTAVSGTWTVPSVPPSKELASHAIWVGIGGQTTSDLIQAGTYAISVDNVLEYRAWYELLPAASIPISMKVRPGDSMSVAIWESTPDEWHISIANNTTKESFQKIVQYHSSYSSAEWIVERPIIDDVLAPLDAFGTVSFADAMAVQNGNMLTAGQTGAELFNLIERKNQLAISVPTALFSNGRAFTVYRTSAPSLVSSAVSVGYTIIPTRGVSTRGKTIRWEIPGELITISVN